MEMRSEGEEGKRKVMRAQLWMGRRIPGAGRRTLTDGTRIEIRCDR